MTEQNASSSGVQQLIDRLRDQGVSEGQRQANDLLDETRHRATSMLEQAQAKSESFIAEAEREAERIQQASAAALNLAVRDASVKLREEIFHQFAQELKAIVSRQMAEPDFLRQLLTDITQQVMPTSNRAPTRISLPANVLSAEDLRRNPEELENGSLTQFAVSLAKDVLQRGIEITAGGDQQAGLRVELTGDDLLIDVTDESITQLLLRHLMPRFRAMIEGTAS